MLNQFRLYNFYLDKKLYLAAWKQKNWKLGWKTLLREGFFSPVFVGNLATSLPPTKILQLEAVALQAL